MFGAFVNEFTINYSKDTDRVLNHSAGSKEPTSYRDGNNTYECTLMLGMEDQVAMEQAAKKAGYKDLTELPPSPAVVSYVNSDQRLVQDVITMSFKTLGRQVGESESLRYEHTMFVTGINFDEPI